MKTTIILTEQEKIDAIEAYIRDVMYLNGIWKLVDAYPSMGEFTFELGTIEEVTQDEDNNNKNTTK